MLIMWTELKEGILFIIFFRTGEIKIVESAKNLI